VRRGPCGGPLEESEQVGTKHCRSRRPCVPSTLRVRVARRAGVGQFRKLSFAPGLRFKIDKIAALAGVCRTTVQTTMHEARLLGHIRITERPQPGRKSLPNVVEITSLEWRTWIQRGPSAHRQIGSKSMKMVSTTKNTDLRKKGATDEKEPRRGYGPPEASMRMRA
jgi:hypothetical protein